MTAQLCEACGCPCEAEPPTGDGCLCELVECLFCVEPCNGVSEEGM